MALNGESCTKNNGSAELPDENLNRPLKKARYIWQLKGKYHLKTEAGHSNVSQSRYRNMNYDTSDESDSESNRTHKQRHSENDNSAEVHRKEMEMTYEHQMATQTHKKKNGCCISEMLKTSESLLDYSSSEEFTAIDESNSVRIPVTLTPKFIHDDSKLFGWQCRQAAKCSIDNTINSILEKYKLAPCDASNLVESFEQDEDVVDEGILMAIQRHGLHSGSTRHMDDATSSREKGGEEEANDQFNFLQAAVSVAIQKKGLHSSSYD